MLNNFYDFCECNVVSGNAQLLFHTLLMINNRCVWEQWFSRTNVSLSERMGISEKAFIRARNELKQLGLIDFISSKKRGTCTKYCILYNTNDSTKEVQKKYKGSTKEVQKADINRYKTETKIKKDISDDISKKTRTIFRPPTVQEVKDYCEQRGNSIDAEYFVDFYTSKNWMVEKNKMKDWKACVRTWERNSRQAKPVKQAEKNGFHNFEQREYDYAALENKLAHGR